MCLVKATLAASICFPVILSGCNALRADIDYAEAEALTTYGIIGIKVWIYKGEVFAREFSQETNKIVPKEGKE